MPFDPANPVPWNLRSVFPDTGRHDAGFRFYQKIADYETKKATEFITRKQEFYRMEQIGTPKEEFADLNRIWSTGQYSSSVYSSVYNADYQEFRTKTFELEEPIGIF